MTGLVDITLEPGRKRPLKEGDNSQANLFHHFDGNHLTYFHEYILHLDNLRENYLHCDVIQDIHPEQWHFFDEYDTFDRRNVTDIQWVIFHRDNSTSDDWRSIPEAVNETAENLLGDHIPPGYRPLGDAKVSIVATTAKGGQFLLSIPSRLLDVICEAVPFDD